MFMSFIVGLIFGVGSGVFEKTVSGPLRKKMEFSDTEIGILSFAGLMLLASIIVSALNFDSSAFWLVLGGVIGAFAIRSFVFGKSKMEERKLAAQAAASDVAETVKKTADDAAGTLKVGIEDAVDAVKS